MTLFGLLLRLRIVPKFTVFILNFKHKLTHVLAYNCSIVTCQNITRHMIWDTLFFCSTAQAWNAFRTELLHCFVINWYQSLSSLTVSLFHHCTGKLCHVYVFQLVSLLFEEKRKEYYKPSHSQVQNEHVPSLWYTADVCATSMFRSWKLGC